MSIPWNGDLRHTSRLHHHHHQLQQKPAKKRQHAKISPLQTGVFFTEGRLTEPNTFDTAKLSHNKSILIKSNEIYVSILVTKH
jgi:hypothetical protein